ncbi:hypothetical protein J3459_017341 [Metarhizium acridum]|nr:hypothetical protein J3459_017341 [Metarhizium acridum]
MLQFRSLAVIVYHVMLYVPLIPSSYFPLHRQERKASQSSRRYSSERAEFGSRIPLLTVHYAGISHIWLTLLRGDLSHRMFSNVSNSFDKETTSVHIQTSTNSRASSLR